MALFGYLEDCQRLLRDQQQAFWNPGDLVAYINRARRMVAETAQCIRVVPPDYGQVQSITVTNGGSGYSATPTITISAPDAPSGMWLNPGGKQAAAIATVVGGVIQSINMTDGGDGYFQPSVTITDSTGSGAMATAQTSPLWCTQPNQEFYRFADIPLGSFPGVKSVLNVRSVALLYSNWRFVNARYSWYEYQAYIRRYPFQYTYVPAIASQLAQGTQGTMAMYPIASARYRMEWDCICLPSDLATEQDVEAIPEPWTDAVAYLALHYAYLEAQNFNYARGYLDLFDSFMARHGAAARPGITVNPYGRR